MTDAATTASYTRCVLRAKAAACDARLHNERTRHRHLCALYSQLQARFDEVVGAAKAVSPQAATDHRHALALALHQIQRSAALLDQVSATKRMGAWQKAGSHFDEHFESKPRGLVGVIVPDVATSDVPYKNPIDAILGPFVGALAAGNAVVIFSRPNALAEILASVMYEARIDRQAFALLQSHDLSSLYKTKILDIFDQLVAFQDLGDVAPKAEVLHVNAEARNLIIVDQSLVSEKVYRNAGLKATPSRRQLQPLEAVADTIAGVLCSQPQGTSVASSILVSENIQGPFEKLLQECLKSKKSAPSKLPVVLPCASSEAILAEVDKRSVAALFIFAQQKFGVYYADSVSKDISCVINALPLDLVVGQATRADAVKIHDENLMGGAGFCLGSLWPAHLFSQTRITINAPFQLLRNRTNSRNSLEKRILAGTALPLVSMPRGHQNQWEFFPSGFKITAFPTALGIVSLLSFGVVRGAMFGWKVLVT